MSRNTSSKARAASSSSSALVIRPFLTKERRLLDELIQHSGEPELMALSRNKRTEGIAELERFLSLKIAQKDWDATLLSPSPSVDRLWHVLVLATALYQGYCERCAGRLLHHNPAGSYDGKRAARYENTYAALDDAAKALVHWWPTPASLGDAVPVEFGMTVIVRGPGGDEVIVPLAPDATLGDLKRAAAPYFQAHPDGAIFSIPGTDAQRLVEDLGIKDDTTVQMDYLGVVVKVLLPMGTVMELRLMSRPLLLNDLFAAMVQRLRATSVGEMLFVQGEQRAKVKDRLEPLTSVFDPRQMIYFCLVEDVEAASGQGAVVNADMRGTITVKTLTGKTFQGQLPLARTTLRAFRQWIQDMEGIPPCQQRLVYEGQQMDTEERMLADYGITPGKTVHLVLGLRGC